MANKLSSYQQLYKKQRKGSPQRANFSQKTKTTEHVLLIGRRGNENSFSVFGEIYDNDSRASFKTVCL